MPPNDEAEALDWQQQRERVQPIYDALDDLAERLGGSGFVAEVRRQREVNLRWYRALGQPTVLVPSLVLDWGRN